ncbi:MAG TPA: hypothetical protein VG269_21220 [Tepidisphaeraceae bacterium]|nr:hypothetical protein [Tepidisphaeraceae bacterium]
MPDPTQLLSPAKSAFPRYAGVFDALAGLIATDAPPPVVSTPPTVPAPPPASSVTLRAGQFAQADGNGALLTADFGDPAGAFNVLRGYNAAHVYDAPGVYKLTLRRDGKPDEIRAVTVLPDARPQVALPPTGDLAAALGQLHDDTILLLPPGATFDLKAGTAVSSSGVTLRAAGPGPAPRVRRLAAPNMYSALIITGHDVSIEGIEFDSDRPLAASNDKVGIYALNVQGKNLLVRNCTFRNVDDAVHCQPQAQGLLVVGCTFTQELRSCALFFDAMQDAVALGNNAAGSQNEHIARFEGAHNVLLHGNDFANHDGKETVTIRIGDCIAVMNNTLRAWACISEGQPTPAVHCHDVLLANNHFAGLRPGGAWLQIDPNCNTITIDSNTFDVDAQQMCVAIQGPCTGITLTNNRQSPVPGAASVKSLVHAFGTPQYSETGTSVVPAQ